MTATLYGQIVDAMLDGQAIDGTPAKIMISCDNIGSFVVKGLVVEGLVIQEFALNAGIGVPPLSLDAINKLKADPPKGVLDTWSVADRDVILRFDSEEPKTEHWLSHETDYLGFTDSVSPHQPYAFLERLATGSHRKLAVRSTLHDIKWTAVFDLSQSAPVAQEVLETCPESGWEIGPKWSMPAAK